MGYSYCTVQVEAMILIQEARQKKQKTKINK
jgi:hypothetical protein